MNDHDTKAFTREAAMGAYQVARTVLREAETKLLLSWGWRRGAVQKLDEEISQWWRHNGVDGPRTQGAAMKLLLEELDG